jgi:hypothetical protein
MDERSTPIDIMAWNADAQPDGLNRVHSERRDAKLMN